MSSFTKTHPVGSMVSGAVVNLPTPSSITSLWNFGSILGACLISQLLTGLLLSMHFASDTSLAFESVSAIMREVNLGWLYRATHANGASLFFICLYLHLGRGIYYGGYKNQVLWNLGGVLLLLVMATAFLGYVLPWGQMSFWGATVITNLFSAIPYIGQQVVFWIWGGFSVDNATFTRFYSLHFLLPFVTAGVAVLHLLFLHSGGSSNPLGVNSNLDKIRFHPYFSWKDLFGFGVTFFALLTVSMQAPWALGDVENFIPTNPLVTPLHIQPEWYFLFAYAILRSIPSKLGGVLALGSAVIVIFILPLYHPQALKSSAFCPTSQVTFWSLASIFLLLTWIGARPVEEPYIVAGQALSVAYFAYFLLNPWIIEKIGGVSAPFKTGSISKA